MNRSPLLSVVLPTYNRPEYIPLAIKTVLNQTFINFELLVLDNGDKNVTQPIIQSFKDKRIIYRHNHKNLGFARNLKNGFRFAKGKYIFTMSDDDLILRTDTFSTVIKKMEEKQAGYAQLGLTYYDHDYRKPSVLDHVATKLIYQPPSPDVLLKTIRWHYGFMSGNIFRRDFIDIENDLHDTDIWWPYLKAAYRAMVNHGGFYFGKYFIIARTSTGLLPFLDLEKSQGFYMDRLFVIYNEFDPSEERLAAFKKNRLDIVVHTFPGIKYYTSNKNIKNMAKAIVKNRPEYIFEFGFWFQLIKTLLAPKFVLSLMRPLRTFIGRMKLKKLAEQLELETNLEKVLK